MQKLLILCSRTFRLSIRNECCHCIPIVLIQCLIALLLICSIIFISNYVVNENNPLFQTNSNEKCSTNNRNNEINLFQNCFVVSSLFYSKSSSQIEFVVRWSHQSDLLEKFLKNLQTNDRIQQCVHINLQQNRNDAFSESAFVIVFEIKELNVDSFEYELTMEISDSDELNERLIHRIDLRFVSSFSSPSDQLDVFQREISPFSDLKLLLDQIYLNVIHDDEILLKLNVYRIGCVESRSHRSIPTRWLFISILYSISLIYLFVNLFVNYLLNKEKKEKIKEMLQIVNLKSFEYYLSWSLISFMFVCLLTFMIVGLMKMKWNDWIIFESISLKVLLLSVTLLNVQLIVYSIFTSQLFVDYSHLFVLNVFVYMLMNVCSTNSWICYLNPYFSLINLFRILFVLERSRMEVNLLVNQFEMLPRLMTIYVLIMISIVIYSLLIWYLDKVNPGQFGIRLKWNFCFQFDYWFRSQLSKQSLTQDEDENENEENNENLIVEVKDLTKVYERNLCVLNKISFDLYENEITCLLGQNGAGKTTLMNILAGFIEQTRGNVRIMNEEKIENVRHLISFCPQHDILFDLLTVREQLEFYCQCKGYRENIDEMLLNLIESIDLLEHENVFCKNLSGGMRRRVSLACAFIGESKLILLDEASSGVDPLNRRLLWDWIRSMKVNRTILLTTHFLEEADYLSDRIVIVDRGRIVAIDSSKQLKQNYGNGFKFILYKNRQQIRNEFDLFDFIRNYLPNCEIEIETRNQLIIQSNETSSDKISQILFQFDLLKQNEIIRNYSLSQTNLEDVFLNLIPIDQQLSFEQIQDNCQQIYSLTPIQQQHSFDFYFNQFQGLTLKSLIIMKKTFVYLVILVVVSFVIHFYFHRMSKQSNEIIYSFDKLTHLSHCRVYIVDQFTNHQIESLQQRYSTIEFISLKNMSNVEQLNEFLLNRRRVDLNSYIRDCVGLLIDGERSISLLTSHLLIGYESIHFLSNYFCQNQCSIRTHFRFRSTNKTKRRTNRSLFSILKVFSLLSCFYGIYPGEFTEIDLLIVNLISIYLIILIRSESKDLVDLMKIFGLNSTLNFLSNYLFCLILTVIYSLIVYSFVVYFPNESNNNKNESLIRQRFYLLTFVNYLSLLPFLFWISKSITNEFLCGLMIYLLLVVIELIDYIRLIFVMINDNVRLYWLFNILIPSLNNKRLISMFLRKFQKDFCEILSKETELMNKYKFRKEIHENDLSKHLLISLIQFVIYSLLNVYSFRINFNLINRLENDDFDENELDENVFNERERLLTRNRIDVEDPLICLDLVKTYRGEQTNAIDHLTFSMKQGECFALLGLNGAGKSSLYKMLVGLVDSTQGEIYLNGQLVERRLFSNEKHIGYCPQYDFNQKYLSVRDYLQLFLYLKGIVQHEINETIEMISSLFLLDDHLMKTVDELSGGTRRRLHTALACLPNSNLIILDEPTTGVDPSNRKQMRFIFEYLLNDDKSLLLTSHSMEECQLLANRFAILNQGQFLCFDSIENLLQRFQFEFYLFIQFQFDENLSKFLSDLQSQIDFEFIEEKRQFLVLKSKEKCLLKLFQTIELLKDMYSIESYQIQPTAIEQIFFQLLNEHFID